MAMNGNTMGDEVVAAIKALSGSPALPQDPQIKVLWEAICTAIVTHIKNNAVVIQASDSHGDTEQNGTII